MAPANFWWKNVWPGRPRKCLTLYRSGIAMAADRAEDCFGKKSVPAANHRSYYGSVVNWAKWVDRGSFWVQMQVHGKPGSSLLVVEHGSEKAKPGRKDFDRNQLKASGEE